MTSKNSATFAGGDFKDTSIHVGDKITKIVRPRKSTSEYPPGSIGLNLHKRNYIKYLVERYHRYRDADKSFGRKVPYSYAVIYKNIENKFQAPAYYIHEDNFDLVAEYLHGCIERTILGKGNRKRGISNFKSFDEYVLEQSSAMAAQS